MSSPLSERKSPHRPAQAILVADVKQKQGSFIYAHNTGGL